MGLTDDDMISREEDPIWAGYCDRARKDSTDFFNKLVLELGNELKEEGSLGHNTCLSAAVCGWMDVAAQVAVILELNNRGDAFTYLDRMVEMARYRVPLFRGKLAVKADD